MSEGELKSSSIAAILGRGKREGREEGGGYDAALLWMGWDKPLTYSVRSKTTSMIQVVK